jgi:hypothetical protein
MTRASALYSLASGVFMAWGTICVGFGGGCWLVVVLLVAGAVFGYWQIIGRPFSFNAMLNTQLLAQVLDHPQELTSSASSTARCSISIRASSTIIRWPRGEYDTTRCAPTRPRSGAGTRPKLSPQEKLSYDIALWADDRALADEKYPWLGADGQAYPVNQAFRHPEGPAEFPALAARDQERQAGAALCRAPAGDGEGAGRGVDADVARQAGLGVVPPDFIVDDDIDQMKALIADRSRRTTCWSPIWRRNRRTAVRSLGRTRRDGN